MCGYFCECFLSALNRTPTEFVHFKAGKLYFDMCHCLDVEQQSSLGMHHIQSEQHLAVVPLTSRRIQSVKVLAQRLPAKRSTLPGHLLFDDRMRSRICFSSVNKAQSA